MALRANIYLQEGFDAQGLEAVAAGTTDGRFHIFGMYTFFHRCLGASISCVPWQKKRRAPFLFPLASLYQRNLSPCLDNAAMPNDRLPRSKWTRRKPLAGRLANRLTISLFCVVPIPARRFQVFTPTRSIRIAPSSRSSPIISISAIVPSLYKKAVA